MKICKTCKIEKELTDYYLRTKEAYFPNCKICFNQRKKDKYKAKKTNNLSLKEKLELKDDLRFRIEIIKQLFKID